MTFAVLRALQSTITDAIDDIERVYLANSPPTSPTPNSPPYSFSGGNEDSPPRSHFRGPAFLSTPPSSPRMADDAEFNPVTPKQRHPKLSLALKTPKSFMRSSHGSPASRSPFSPSSEPPSPVHFAPSPLFLDFPSLDSLYDPNSAEEALTSHPTVIAAINRIIAAAGQLSVTVQKPFLTLCDASMGYHLPSCLRFLESTHIVEILREAGPCGLHAAQIADRCGCERGRVSHILRLLATHHILREVSPDVFANNRVSAHMDTGKDSKQLKQADEAGKHEQKYEQTNGVSAFVGLCTDEIFKASSYLTESYAFDPTTKFSRDISHAPFNRAFGTDLNFFGWLERTEGESADADEGKSTGGESCYSSAAREIQEYGNKFRLERFGKAMSATVGWETPGAIFQGFDWGSIPGGGVVIDVGGGIGWTTVLLARAFQDLRFVVQDREVVVELGEKAWKARCPELLESGRAKFQVHDFFTPQPIQSPAVFLLRVVLHDWPDQLARRILLRLREAASEHTRLLIADFVMPLACVDDFGFESEGSVEQAGGREAVDGAERTLAPDHLLANLGKASANVYWMDLTMQVMFNSQERTLREIVQLASSAGWKVVKVTRSEGLFGHIIAVPVPIPVQRRARAGSGSALLEVGLRAGTAGRRSAVPTLEALDTESSEPEMAEPPRSRCSTPTFGSRVDLPSVEEVAKRFGGRTVRSGGGSKAGLLGRGIVLTDVRRPPVPPKKEKKRPSPLVDSTLGLGLGGGLAPSPSFSSYAPRVRGTTSPASPASYRQNALQSPVKPSVASSSPSPSPSPSSPRFQRSPPPSTPPSFSAFSPPPSAKARVQRSGSILAPQSPPSVPPFARPAPPFFRKRSGTGASTNVVAGVGASSGMGPSTVQGARGSVLAAAARIESGLRFKPEE